MSKSIQSDFVQSFGDLFPLAERDEEGFFWHADGSVSAIWLCHPISAEHLTGEARHGIANVFGRAIASLPPGSTVQISTRAVPNIDWALGSYIQNGGTSHKWWQQYEMARVNAIRSWTKGMEGVGLKNTQVKDIQTLIVLTIYESQDETVKQIWQDVRDVMTKPPVSDFNLPPLKKTKAHLRTLDGVQALASQIRADQSAFEKAFTTMGLPFRQANEEIVARYTKGLLDPVNGPTDPVVIDPDLFLSEMICPSRLEFEPGGKYILCNGTYQSMLSVDTYPEQFYAGILSLNNSQFEDDRSILDYLGDGVLTVSCKVVEKTETLAFLDNREQQSKGGKSEAVEKQVAFNDVQDFKDWITNQHRTAVDMAISIKVCGESPFIVDQKAKSIRSLFQALQFSLRIEDTDAKTVWCEHLPGGFNKMMHASGQRIRRRRDIVFSGMAPLYLVSRGVKNYVHFVFNQHFEPYAFDHFSHKRSFNVAVVGEPGSGKSGKIQDIITDNCRQEHARAFILDWGGSYSCPTNISDSEGLDAALSLESKLATNIFAGPPETTIPMLLDWLPGLALQPDEKLDPIVEAMIATALNNAYGNAQKIGMPFRDLMEIPKRYPGYWPMNARKRVKIQYLNEIQQNQIREMLRGDEVSRPKFYVYFVIRIKSYIQEKVNTRRSPRTMKDLGVENIKMLRNEFAYLEEDDIGPYVLSVGTKAADTLVSKSWEVEIDQECMIAESRGVSDFRQLLAAKVKVIFDDAWKAEQFTLIRDSLIARFGSDHAKFGVYLRECMEGLDPLIYYNAIDGKVDLQGEIIFSNFISESIKINDPRLKDFIDRLAQWHGSGLYADYFDRRGGINLADYRFLVWDFKPIWKANDKFVLAMLGAVLTQIQVFCDSVLTLHLRKNVVLDEFHEFKSRFPERVVRFVDRITLQARKNKYCMIVGTQKIDHLFNSGVPGVNLIDQFQHYFIGSQLEKSIELLKTHFGFTDEQCYIASQARMEPGKYADFLLYISATNTCEIVRSIQTSWEYWFKTSSADERSMRLASISKFQRDFGKSLAEATVLACQELSEKYPRGLRAATIVEIK
jgi:hypothetical protein